MKQLPASIRAALDANSYRDKLAIARATLAGGVTAIAVHQLFPTPGPVVDRILQRARIRSGDRVLEPQAGTAHILRAIERSEVSGLHLVAVEIDERLAQQLRTRHTGVDVICNDFLNVRPDELGEPFDVIATNPPFTRHQDVEHIRHALRFRRPGGRLVGVMLNDGQCFRPELSKEPGYGRRADRVAELRAEVLAQGAVLRVEPLPPASFRSQGTDVDTALVTIE